MWYPSRPHTISPAAVLPAVTLAVLTENARRLDSTKGINEKKFLRVVHVRMKFKITVEGQCMIFITSFPIGIVARVFADGPVDRGSISGRVMSKTKKFDT